ncbi:MAG: branched-chain amino acid ABC transporter permease [Burkholderiales bacterium]|nr:branched-chain amino acid ABC transporter permease [Burkholderiales bacterium]
MAARFATPRAGGMAALAALIALLPLGLRNDYFYDVAILVGLNAIVCVGLNLLVGYAGQISLGHAGFFGIGAYGSAILATRYGWPPLAAMLAATLAAAAIAFAVGRPILRLRGHYLAMATLALGVIVYMVISTEDRFTGGPDGMTVAPLAIGGWALRDPRLWYWVVGALLLAAVWFALNLIDSPTGRALRALHGSEVAAEVVGVDATRHKVMVFVVSAVYASIAGSLNAHFSGFITPAKVTFLHSIELVTMVVFGGMASTFGAVVGAAALTTLPQVLTPLKDYEMMVLGAVMMGTMIFMPRGVVPSLQALLTRRRDAAAAAAAPAPRPGDGQ